MNRNIEQEKTSRNRGTFFQAKLKVNQPGDQFEQEADAMAEEVVKDLNTLGQVPTSSAANIQKNVLNAKKRKVSK
ncbi:hypothetical protein V8V91_17165 [Algoriphagus halophilus]|uniref:hypothetical protein n=1 Tax=Algoriphagus halophilus TaxID=226505 RepID=UPI00358DF885